jgi:hypothetical protein
MPVSQTKKDNIHRNTIATIGSYFLLKATNPVIVSIAQITTAISTVHCTKQESIYASIYNLISCANEYTLTAFITPDSMKHTPSVMRKAFFIFSLIVLLI